MAADMQQYFATLLKQYPWATEDTLDQVNANLTGVRITIGQISAVLAGGDAISRAKIATRRADSASKKASLSENAVAEAGKISNSAIKSITSGSSPANAIADMSHEVAKLLYNAGVGIGNLTGPVRGKAAAVATVVGKGSKMLLYGAVAATGVGTVYAKLLSEQEKYSRALIEFGSIAGDIDMYTTLRASIRSLGMGFKEFAEIGDAAKPFLVSAGGDVLKGQYKLAEFINSIDKHKLFNDYGMSVQDQARAITQETEALYQLGQIEEVNAMTQKRVMKSFESANQLALFTGNSLGMQRMEALKLREAARTNEDFTGAIIQNADYIAKELGAAAQQNIIDTVGFMAVINGGTMGDEFMEQFNRDVTGTLSDISYDQSAANNMNSEYYAKLQAIGPEVAATYLKLVEDTSTGKIVGEKMAVDRQRELLNMIRNADIKIGRDPMLQEANKLIAQAQLIPKSYYNADSDNLISSSYYQRMIDSSDNSIDVIDNFAVTFQNIQELITPGFETTGKSFEFLAKGILKFGGAISKFVGQDSSFKAELEKEQKENRQAVLTMVTAGNVDSSIQQVIIRLDEIKAQQETLAEFEENPWEAGEDGEKVYGDLTEIEQRNIDFKQEQMEDELLELQKFKTGLLKKKAEFKQKDNGNRGR